MPRKDGFDTNQEMLADFNASAHEVLIAAYERAFEDGLSPAYIGKPLDVINLYIVRRPDGAADNKNTLIGQQVLDVSIISKNDVEDMTRHHLTMRNLPEDVHTYYATVAEAVGGTVLSSDLDIRQVLPVQGIIADYTAHLVGEERRRTRHVNTMKDKPTKLSLALAKTFVDEAADYVDSDAFELSRRFGSTAAAAYSTMTHGFRLALRADLPLNGNEPMAWLTLFADRMHSEVATRGPRLEELKALEAPEKMLASEQQKYDQAVAALKRAQEIIDRK